jgi:hypothetical protein
MQNCILLWTAINATFWVCELNNKPNINSLLITQNNRKQLKNNFTINNTININNTIRKHNLLNLTNTININNTIKKHSLLNLTNHLIQNNTISINNTLENITFPKIGKNNTLFNLHNSNSTTTVNNSLELLNNFPSPSKKNLRNKLSPSPVISINDKKIYKDNENIIIILDKNITNSTNLDNLDNLIFLNFLWFILPLICFYSHIYRKKHIKSNKIGCFNFTKNKLKRCKSMPNLYAAVPTALPKRMTVSETEIDLVL